MQFRYMPFWLFWPLVALWLLLLWGSFSALLGPGVNLLRLILPEPRAPLGIAIGTLFGFSYLCLLNLPLLKIHRYLKRYYPGAPILMSEHNVTFRSPIGLTAEVDWNDIKQIDHLNNTRGPNHIVLQFRTPLIIHKDGPNEPFRRIVFNESRILPSGELFSAVARQHHQAARGTAG